MDMDGKVLFKILRKKLSLFGRWRGQRCDGDSTTWFEVRRHCRMLLKNSRGTVFEVRVGRVNNIQTHCLKMEDKSAFKVVDMGDGLLAQVGFFFSSFSSFLYWRDLSWLILRPS
ncbi:hypothetical protein QJS04_geneDACA007284 [Acorus gramineus]|uniref:Uncharacterized protein n=1 Tax=Acorus gramineus TaxID=55184 RepID=A0AAV9BS60_ACOGR|nr:hypothetical protein QJS04_geneDACA007284 [Acorus gramineus]